MKKFNKDRILLIQGHFYIFQATGVYYIADLSEDFDVDIIVPSEYKEIEKFHYLIKDLNINNIYYVKGFVYFDSTSSIFDIKNTNKKHVSDEIQEAEKELNKDDLNDQKRFLLNHKVEILKSISIN